TKAVIGFDDIPRVLAQLDWCGTKKPIHGPTRTEDARELPRQLFAGLGVDEVEQVPTENAVEHIAGVAQACEKRFGKALGGPLLSRRFKIEIEVLDVELAVESFAEVLDVGAHHRTEVEQYGTHLLRLLGDGGEEAGKHLRRGGDLVDRRRRRDDRLRRRF